MHRGEDCHNVDATVLTSEIKLAHRLKLAEMQKFGPDATDGQCLQQHRDLKQCIKATVSSVNELCHVDVEYPLPIAPSIWLQEGQVRPRSTVNYHLNRLSRIMLKRR